MLNNDNEHSNEKNNLKNAEKEKIQAMASEIKKILITNDMVGVITIASEEGLSFTEGKLDASWNAILGEIGGFLGINIGHDGTDEGITKLKSKLEKTFIMLHGMKQTLEYLEQGISRTIELLEAGLSSIDIKNPENIKENVTTH
ncbi:MAG: hypothetical protein V4525_11090 [Pseudomonadota bacterium]